MRRILAAASVLVVTAVPARAQCTGVLADACTKAADMWTYMAPQLGTALVGGSHTLGIGSTLGGLPHFAVALRVNAVLGNLPDLTSAPPVLGAPVASNIDSPEAPIPMPSVDFALGVYKGFSLGVTKIGSVDVLASATYLPKIEDSGSGLAITPTDGSTKIGYGVRVGLLQQSLLIPGVSFSYLMRDLPTVTLDIPTGGTDAISISNFSMESTSWRLSAQKNLLILQLSAGYGQDTYNSKATIGGTVAAQPFGETRTLDDLKRTSMYAGVGINLLLVKVIAEVGRVSGGTVSTFNNFATPADEARTYGSLGVRISF